MPSVTGTTSIAKTTATQASLSFAHTANGDPLYVGIGMYISPVRIISTVTYGGVPLSQISREVPPSSLQAIEWWYLAAPAIGTANIVITPDAAAYMAAVGRNISGGNRAAVTMVSAAPGAGSTAPSVVVPSAVGALVIDLVASDSSNQVFTVGAGQSVDAALNNSVNSDTKVAASREPGAASVTMSWTLSVSDFWTISGMSIPPQPAGGGLTTRAFLLEEEPMPYNVWKAITPSNTVDLATPTSGILVGGAGDVAAVQQNGSVVVLKGLPAGAWLPIVAKRINATGTTATDLVALNNG